MTNLREGLHLAVAAGRGERTVGDNGTGLFQRAHVRGVFSACGLFGIRGGGLVAGSGFGLFGLLGLIGRSAFRFAGGAAQRACRLQLLARGLQYVLVDLAGHRRDDVTGRGADGGTGDADLAGQEKRCDRRERARDDLGYGYAFEKLLHGT